MRRLIMLFASSLVVLSLAACGSSDSSPTQVSAAAPSAEEVPFHVKSDVRDALLRTFAEGASRPAPRVVDIRLDYRELGRQFVDENVVEISGEFLFSVDQSPLRRGRIVVAFTWRNDRWQRTDTRITEQDVGSHRIALRLSDIETDEPVANALVSAQRVDNADLSSHIGRTDATGFVELEVFPGVFQVEARSSTYRATVTDHIPVPEQGREVRIPLHKLDTTVL